MAILRSVSTIEEREYERQHILRQRQRYLAADVVSKVLMDRGYAEKVREIERALGPPKGLILDIGSNTCGEAEYLTTRGYSIVATDINEIALGLSQARCARFGRRSPSYVACDGHRLAIQNESIQFVMFNESLHHMDNPLQVLQEASRVLVPGGGVYLYEPYAYNPYRRVSEIRDRFRGTIERSFGVAELKRLLRNADLIPLSVRRRTYVPSEWKMQVMSAIHKALRWSYFAASRLCPFVFGNLIVTAEKPKRIALANPERQFELILRCPTTGSRLLRVDEGYLSADDSFRGFYPSHQGIPVLIAQEARRLDRATWEHFMYRASSRKL